MNKSIQPGAPATVTALANATGGINPGNFVDTDIDQQLFQFNSDDTPLMNLMLRAKRVKVHSPEVDHYMIDEPKSTLTTVTTTSADQIQVNLPLIPGEQNLPREYTTLLVKGGRRIRQRGEERDYGEGADALRGGTRRKYRQSRGESGQRQEVVA